MRGPGLGLSPQRQVGYGDKMNETCQDITKTKPLLVLQQGHGVHLFLCFQGGRVDLGDPGGQEDQQVQFGLGHPERNKTK